MSLTSKAVRAVVLHAAIGAIGGDDEVHTSLELQGFAAAWMPGDHALSLIIGGGELAGTQLEPALTVVVPAMSAWKLADSILRPPQPPPEIRKPRIGIVLGYGQPARRSKGPRSWGESAEVKTYMLEAAPPAFPYRPYVVEVASDRHRFRIFLTLEEVDDLWAVLIYKPAWSKA